MDFRASVIVPTYNGGKKITAVLEALSRQTVMNFELIVVIDGSTDNTSKLVQEYSTRFETFRVIVQENRGRAAVRNRGVVEAREQLFIFYDDDTIPQQDSVARHIQFHLKNPSVGILAGNLPEYYSKAKTDIQNYKSWLTKKWVAEFTNDINLLQWVNLFLTAANMSVGKVVFQKLNGFDERLTDSEDQDLAKRAMEMGIPVYFDKTNIAEHIDPITCSSYIRRQRQYAQSKKKLHEIKPSLHPLHQTAYWKKVIYYLFSFSFWPRIIDQQPAWLKYMPRFIRYKLYDVVIHSMSKEFPDRPLNLQETKPNSI